MDTFSLPIIKSCEILLILIERGHRPQSVKRLLARWPSQILHLTHRAKRNNIQHGRDAKPNLRVRLHPVWFIARIWDSGVDRDRYGVVAGEVVVAFAHSLHHRFVAEADLGRVHAAGVETTSHGRVDR